MWRDGKHKTIILICARGVEDIGDGAGCIDADI